MAELLLEARNIKKSYAMRDILDIASFEIFDGDRIGLVGENGAGKTTFVSILSGDLEADSGTVRRLAPIAVIQQMGKGAADDAEIDRALGGEFDAQPLRDGLSGGEKTRRRIAGALSKRGHLLIADEPTTDLDSRGVERLEKRLKEYDGAIILISHDRALLNGLCTKIAELEDGKITIYPGNYSAYRAEKENRRAHQQFEYTQYREEQSRMREMIQREVELASQKQNLPKRMGNSEARLHKRQTTVVQGKVHQVRKMFESRMDRISEVERPRDDPSIKMKLGAFSPVTSRVAVEIRQMNLRAGGKTLLTNASMKLVTGARTALMGVNGCGKSTLMSRIIKGNDPRIRINPGVKIGWFDQEHENTLDMNASAIDNVMAESVYPQSTARTILARLNLRGDDVFKKISVLSGGERAKVALAKLFAGDINLLMLDEPTNHIDVFTLEALQSVLGEYGGTLLVVSHDREFIKNVANRLIFFENESLVTFEGGMEAYLNSKNKDRSEEEMNIKRTTLQMRMAALTMRMSAPKKGDSPDKLNEEYENLSRELMELR